VVFVDGGVDVAFVGEILDGFADLLLREPLLGELLEDVADPRPALSVLAQRTDVSQNLVLHSRQPLHRRRSIAGVGVGSAGKTRRSLRLNDGTSGAFLQHLMDHLCVNDFENVAGELVEVVDGEDPEGDDASSSLNVSYVPANTDQSVLPENLRFPLAGGFVVGLLQPMADLDVFAGEVVQHVSHVRRSLPRIHDHAEKLDLAELHRSDEKICRLPCWRF